jgi:hypothetical protein
MSTTLDEVSALLTADEIKHRVRDGAIYTGFATDLYEDREGDNCANLVLRVDDDGELLRIQAPLAFSLPKDASPEIRAAVLSTLHQLNWESKIMQFEIDLEDGEIRLGADIPLEDGTLTEAQLGRTVRLLPALLDQAYLPLRDALDHGLTMPTEAELFRRTDAFIRSLA